MMKRAEVEQTLASASGKAEAENSAMDNGEDGCGGDKGDFLVVCENNKGGNEEKEKKVLTRSNSWKFSEI
jgi:hypothetical protein